jgi:hypothetical protein
MEGETNDPAEAIATVKYRKPARMDVVFLFFTAKPLILKGAF